MQDVKATAVAGQYTLVVVNHGDIIKARYRGRALAHALGFSPAVTTLLVSAISELTGNIVRYADAGTLRLRAVRKRSRIGLAISARDRGPGIAEVERALVGGYSTSGRLGLGLCSVNAIMDEMRVTSRAGRGTAITAVKWQE
ncbi:MAG: anti-sigma regulatory factor [Gammaproteobacteria bacterium]|nr:MAG: anti-sigma regulatory factor [Gammaproteobacteria bacterium]